MLEFLATWGWPIGGVVLMLAEFLIPGGVVGFVGAAALLVAIGRWVGLLENWISSVTAWFLLSILMLVTVRNMVMRYMPGDSSYESPDEDAEAFGKEVRVIETVAEVEPTGRIEYQGSTWPAISSDGAVLAGRRAKIVSRENTVWIVEPLD